MNLLQFDPREAIVDKQSVSSQQVFTPYFLGNLL